MFLVQHLRYYRRQVVSSVQNCKLFFDVANIAAQILAVGLVLPRLLLLIDLSKHGFISGIQLQ